MTNTPGAPASVQDRVSAGELARVIVVMIAVAAALNFRLVTQLGSALPNDLGDPLLNTFILGWDADRLLHGLKGLWDAPFYFPRRDTLAYSEHLLGIAIFTAPVQWLTGNPVLAYNVAHLGSYVLAGVGMYLLARALWGRADAAWVAAIAFACAPYRVAQTAHLQTLMSGWMPIGLWALHRYFRVGSRRALAVFAVAFILQALSNGYYLYFFAVPVVVVVLAKLGQATIGRDRDPATRYWTLRGRLIDLSVAATAMLAVLAPVAAAYIRVRERMGLHRVVDEIEGYSAVLGDYLRRPVDLWLWQRALKMGEGEREMFPGLVVTVLAVVALAKSWRSRPVDDTGAATGRRAIAWLYAVILGLAVWMSLGPGPIGPYRLLLDVVPGLNGLRVPARIATVVSLALAVLAAGGAARICARLRPRAAAVVAGALALAIGAEGFGSQRQVRPFDPAQPRRAELNAWIRQGPQAGVLELPASEVGAPATLTLLYQFSTLMHGRPVVNGYSGHGYHLQSFLEGGASPLRELAMIQPLVMALRRIGVRTIVLHKGDYAWLMDYEPSPIIALIDEDRRQVLEARSFDVNGVRAWRLADIEPLPVFKDSAWVWLDTTQMHVTASLASENARRAADGDPRTWWDSTIPQRGDEWVRIDLNRERDLVAVQLQLPTDDLGVYPRHLRVECEADDGTRVEVFSGSVLAHLMQSLVREPRRPAITLTLPPNRTRALRLYQAGQTRHAHWSVVEMAIWERTPAQSERTDRH
jgi:hypothetical protein